MLKRLARLTGLPGLTGLTWLTELTWFWFVGLVHDDVVVMGEGTNVFVLWSQSSTW